jgi:hypothetical protein
MTPCVGLLLALRLSTSGATAPHPSVREEVRVVVNETVLREVPSSARPRSTQGELAAVVPPERSPLQAFHDYRAADWVTFVATQLHVESTPVVRAALWVAMRPVQVEASTHRVLVRVRIAGP